MFLKCQVLPVIVSKAVSKRGVFDVQTLNTPETTFLCRLRRLAK